MPSSGGLLEIGVTPTDNFHTAAILLFYSLQNNAPRPELLIFEHLLVPNFISGIFSGAIKI
jgi:hypothetical protein